MERLRISSRERQIGVIMLTLFMALAGAGCKKKTPVATAPPPPVVTPPKATPARPVITQFEAEPASIERGQAATLRWAVTGETTSITITPGIGNVNASGNRQIFPSGTTSYTLTAQGPGGEATMSASVNVAAATPAAKKESPQPRRTLTEFIDQEMKDVYFDYDRSDIREDARAQLTRNADAMKRALSSEFPTASFIVEGHADERGSAEYNLGLSDRRATSAIDFLMQLGVPRDRLKPVSYGRERPQCTETTETCFQMNRRAHFSAGQ